MNEVYDTWVEVGAEPVRYEMDTNEPGRFSQAKTIGSSCGITERLAKYYISLAESIDDMKAEANFTCQVEQSDEPYLFILVRQMEEHRKSFRVNVP